MTKERRKAIDQIEKNFDVSFSDRKLLNQALTHTSFAHERSIAGPPQHNERLEFLGDAIIDLVVADMIYHHFPNAPEGQMARARSQLVCESAMAEIARQFALGDGLNIGRGEERAGGRDRDSILADALEAVVAAVYLDSGWQAAYELVARLWGPKFDEIAGSSGDLISVLDPKSALQEYLQAIGPELPVYRLCHTHGPDHDKTFVSEVIYDGDVVATGTGRSKKEAQQAAAREALRKLKDHSRR